VRNWNVTQQSDCFGVKVEAIWYRVLLAASCCSVNPASVDFDSWQGKLNIITIFVYTKLDFWCHEVRECLIMNYQHDKHTNFWIGNAVITI
jgi:hypothetical protein